MNIYFTDGESFDDVESLINGLYPRYSAKALPTYMDSHCTRRQCGYAHRSFGDLLLIAQTYFPDTTEKDMIALMCSLYQQGLFKMMYCNDISEIIYYRGRISDYDKCIIITEALKLHPDTVEDMSKYDLQWYRENFNKLTTETKCLFSHEQ